MCMTSATQFVGCTVIFFFMFYARKLLNEMRLLGLLNAYLLLFIGLHKVLLNLGYHFNFLTSATH